MTCDLAVEDLPLPDLEAVYRIAAARVTHAVRQGRVEAALRWGRILNLALRDRELRARLPVTPDEVRRRMGEAQPVEEPRERIEAPTPSHPLHCLHPVFESAPNPAPDPESRSPFAPRWTRREGRRRC
jgi:hypothetical protein